MKVIIDRLVLRLPAGFGDRAPEIARQMGEALSRLDHGKWGGAADIRLGADPIEPNLSDRDVADALARKIGATMKRGTGI